MDEQKWELSVQRKKRDWQEKRKRMFLNLCVCGRGLVYQPVRVCVCVISSY